MHALWQLLEIFCSQTYGKHKIAEIQQAAVCEKRCELWIDTAHSDNKYQTRLHIEYILYIYIGYIYICYIERTDCICSLQLNMWTFYMPFTIIVEQGFDFAYVTL